MRNPSILHEIFPVSRTTSDPFIRDGMSPVELQKVAELIAASQPARVLEIGMANGTSSVMIADELRKYGGHLTSIDPHQTMPAPFGYESAGVQAVRTILSTHRLIEEYDYLALPRLVESGERFACILIDGYHSFDLTLLDLFYADLLLEQGGLLLCHDSSSPAVYKALRWLETNKPYTRLSPRLYTHVWPLHKKLVYRLFHAAERKLLQTDWQMLAAYRKHDDRPMPEHAVQAF